MKQDIAEFLADVGNIVGNQSVGEFINFFHGVGAQRFVGLLGIPWAFHSQRVEDFKKFAESFGFIVNSAS